MTLPIAESFSRSIASVDLDRDNTVTIPIEKFLFEAVFSRSGNDLLLVGEAGDRIVVADYFKHHRLPTLVSPEGATLGGDVVELLAGAGQHYAQANAPTGAPPAIGRVSTVSGSATATRNGVAVVLQVGDAVVKGDVIQTLDGSALGLIFTDGTTFTLAANARMVVNEFVYDPTGSSNSSLMSLVQGSINFLAGRVAKSGDMMVATPVGTMGIRGTAVSVAISADNGRTTISVMAEGDNLSHSIVVYARPTASDLAAGRSVGAVLGTVTNDGGIFTFTPTPTGVLVQETQKDAFTLQNELAIVQEVFRTQSIGQQFLQIPDGTTKTASTAHGTQFIVSERPVTSAPGAQTVNSEPTVYKVVIGAPDDKTKQAVPEPPPPVTNAAPVAQTDQNKVVEAGILPGNIPSPGVPQATGNLLANAQDSDVGDSIVLASVAPVSAHLHGTLSVGADGSYTYVLDNDNPLTQALAAGEKAYDVFSYTITDTHGGSATSTLSIEITGANDAPTLAPINGPIYRDTAAFDHFATTTGTLAGSDVDHGTTLSYGIAAGIFDDSLPGYDVSRTGHYGKLYLNSATGAYAFVPNDDAINGLAATSTINEAFEVSVSDGVLSAQRTFVVTLNGAQDAPVAVADGPYVAAEDTLLTVSAANGVLHNDSDAEGDSLTASLVAGGGPAHALSFTLNADGSFSYQAAANYFGPDSFTYRTFDGTSFSSDITVQINVAPVNDAPVANQDGPYAAAEDTLLTVSAANGVLANDTDVDNDALAASLVAGGGPAHALSFTFNADGSFSYQAAANYFGLDSFTYHTFDGTSFSNDITVQINVAPVNDAPVANQDGPYAAAEDTLLTVSAANGVLANDTDVENDTLSASLVAGGGPAHALNFTLNADGSFSYQAAANYFGPDSFTYHTFDGTSFSNDITVEINVAPVNDAPAANQDGPYAAAEDTLLTVSAANGVLANDTDVENDTLSASLVAGGGPAHALNFTLNADGSFSYQAAANYFGPDSFTYRTFDGTSFSNNITVQINVDAAPVAHDDSGYTVALGQTLHIAAPGVLANDTDFENDPLSALLVTGTTNGNLTLNADGSFDYKPFMPGAVTFTYKASDGTINSDAAATVTIQVNTSTADTLDSSNSSTSVFLNASGNPSINNLIGGSNNDTLIGNNNGNILIGGAGNDGIQGGTGNDVVIGGAGNDRLIGGGDDDTFVFRPGSGHDTIFDFTVSDAGHHDTLDLRGLGFASIDDVLNHTDLGPNAVIHLGADDITLNAVTKAALAAHPEDIIVS